MMAPCRFDRTQKSGIGRRLATIVLKLGCLCGPSVRVAFTKSKPWTADRAPAFDQLPKQAGLRPVQPESRSYLTSSAKAEDLDPAIRMHARA